MNRGGGAPTCIEVGCEARCEPRTNWHTMSVDLAMEASEYHHRCRRCFAGWLVREAKKHVRARKHYKCIGCKARIAPGEDYWVGARGTGRRYPERTHVCDECRMRYLALGERTPNPNADKEPGTT